MVEVLQGVLSRAAPLFHRGRGVAHSDRNMDFQCSTCWDLFRQ